MLLGKEIQKSATDLAHGPLEGLLLVSAHDSDTSVVVIDKKLSLMITTSLVEVPRHDLARGHEPAFSNGRRSAASIGTVSKSTLATQRIKSATR